MSGANFKIKNFQSIVDASIRVEGFTILVGESSQGKSACLRAINAACNNKFKQGFLRYGADTIEIGISYDDNANMLVVRKIKTASPEYELGDLVFQKLNRTVPPEIDEFNNFGSIDSYEQKYPLNFFSQFSKPLLLEFSQKRILEILSSSKAFDDMNDAVSKLNKKKEQNNGAFKQLSQMIGDNKSQLSKYVEAESLIHDDIERLKALQDELSECDKLLESIDQLSECIILQEKGEKRLELLESFIRSYEALEHENEELSKLENLDSLLTEQSKADKHIESLSTAIKLCEEYIVKQEELNALRIDSLEELSRLIDESKSTQKKLQECHSICKELEKCVDMKKEIVDIDSQVQRLDYLAELMDTYRRVHKNCKEIQSMIDNHICPVCGNKIA